MIQRDSDCIIDVQAPVPPGPHPSDAAAPSTKPLKNNNPAESADTISRTHVGDGPSKPVGPGRRAHVGGLEIDDDGRVTNGSRAVWIGTDGTRLVTALARVRPALLGIDRLISKTFGGNVSDGAVRLKTLIENVNPRLKGIGLEIRIVHKIGCVLADV